MQFEKLVRRILDKTDRRRRLGWVDYSPGSYDHRVAVARAERIQLRLKGIRITLKTAING